MSKNCNSCLDQFTLRKELKTKNEVESFCKVDFKILIGDAFEPESTKMF